jgi:DNA end-binding protein Ku
MQAIWRGAINFGLISIPVRLFSATEEKTLRFNMLHKEDDGRVSFNRTCKVCGKDNLGKDDLVRGYEYEKGMYVKFDDEELDNVQIDTSHTVEVVHFTPDEQIDPIYYQKSYYLAPDELGVKAYGLLRKVLAESDKVAVTKVAIRDKERLGTLRVRDNVLVLETMYWPDELRRPEFEELDIDVDVRAEEVQMAEMLIENMTRPFEETEYVDRTRERIEELAQSKLDGREIVVPEAEEPSKVVDLLDALRASVEATKARKEAS